MKELHQPHDRYFRTVFGQQDFVRDLMADALPESILRQLDLEAIEVSSDSFVDEKLAGHQSDILVRTRLRRSPILLYVLVEHKSYPYRWTVLQLLRYMLRIWERERSRDPRARELPTIIPMIFYHGRLKWRFPLDFVCYFAPNPGLAPFVPHFTPLMFNLRNLDIERRQGRLQYLAVLRLLKHALAALRPHLPEILRNLTAPPVDDRQKAILVATFEYILQVGKDIEARDIEAELQRASSQEAKEAYVTIAEQLLARGKAEGKLEGKAEGKLEGEIRGKRDVLLRQLEKKFGPLPESGRRTIEGSSDPVRLDRALDLVLEARSVEQVMRALG